MKYELIRDGDIGVIVDPTPIMRDIKDTFTVSFVLPKNGAYVALFRDESGVEYRETVKDNAAKVPKQLLTKEQLVGLTVCQVSDDEILHTWECRTLKVGTFLSLRKTQWQITVGTDDKELFARLAEIERGNTKARTEYAALLVAFDTLQSEFALCKEKADHMAQDYAEQQTELTIELAKVKIANETLATNYNKAIEVINNLSERVTALESNYDPTVIGEPPAITNKENKS